MWIFYSCFSLRRICAKRFSPDTTRQVAPCLHPIGAVDRFRFRISYYIVAFFCARITELWLDVGFPSPSLIGWAAPQLLRRYLGLQISRSLAPSLVVPAPRLHGEQEIMGNRIRNRGGLLLLDKYKHGFVWEWNSICHCRFILSFFSCMPCFLHWCLRLGFVLHGTCQGKATRIPRSTMDHWTLGTSIQMLSSYFVFLPFLYIDMFMMRQCQIGWYKCYLLWWSSWLCNDQTLNWGKVWPPLTLHLITCM